MRAPNCAVIRIVAVTFFTIMVLGTVSRVHAHPGDAGNCTHSHNSLFVPSASTCTVKAACPFEEGNPLCPKPPFKGEFCLRSDDSAGLCVQGVTAIIVGAPPDPSTAEQPSCICSPLDETQFFTAMLSEIHKGAAILGLIAKRAVLKDEAVSCPQVEPVVSIVKAALATLDDTVDGSVNTELVALQLTDLMVIDEIFLVLNQEAGLSKVARQCNTPALRDDIASIREALLRVKTNLLLDRTGRGGGRSSE